MKLADDAADLGSDDEGKLSNSDVSAMSGPKFPHVNKDSKSAGASGSTMMKYILKPNDSSLAATEPFGSKVNQVDFFVSFEFFMHSY